MRRYPNVLPVEGGMFFRLKTSGSRRYLQIVESRWDAGRPRQQVIATLGRADALAQSGALAALLASGARFCEQVMLLSALDDPDGGPRLETRRIGAPPGLRAALAGDRVC